MGRFVLFKNKSPKDLAFAPEGCLCDKDAIKISKDGKMENAHFCKSFECKDECKE